LPVLLVVYALGGLLATDAYLPSMPMLPGVFDTTATAVQFTLTAYFAGVTLANLFYGPLSDRYGRRPVLLFGGIAFLLATLACALATSIEMLTIGRFAQGAAVCSLTVTSRATVRELYDDQKVTKINAYIAMAEGLAPALGPVIGAEILLLLGWRWNFFLVFAIAGLALLALFFVLPESNVRRNRHALKPLPILQVYMRVLLTRDFIGPVLSAGLIFGALILYITVAPFVLIDEFGMSERQYSLAQGAIVICYIVGLVGTSRLVHWLKPWMLLTAGLLFINAGGFLLLGLALAGYETFWAFVGPFGVYSLGIGIAMAPMMTRALSSYRQATGSVAALMGTLTMGCAYIGSQVATVIYDATTLPIAWAVAITSFGALVIYGLSEVGRREHKARARSLGHHHGD
jgi:DHA1 family bicyclomycin/chloramphenicol resistance-like MFS transporter